MALTPFSPLPPPEPSQDERCVETFPFYPNNVKRAIPLAEDCPNLQGCPPLSGRSRLPVALHSGKSQGVLGVVIVKSILLDVKFRFLIMPLGGNWSCMSDMVYYDHAAKKDTC